MIYSWDTEAVVSNASGTGWTLDVTAANLSADLDDKDFVVAFDSVLVDTSQFVKTSQSTVRYDGPATSGVSVELRRNTSIAPFRLVNYSDVILSGDYNRNLERYSRLLAEERAFGGSPVGSVTINNSAYGPGWAGDDVNGASRSAIYDKIEDVVADYGAADTALGASLTSAILLRAPLASPSFTGVPTAPTAAAATNNTQIATTQFVTTGISTALIPYTTTADLNTALALKADLASPALTGVPTAPTPPVATDSTQLATTAFVRRVASEYHAWVQGNTVAAQPSGTAVVQTGGTATIRNGTTGSSSYNPSTGRLTVPVSGRYRITIGDGVEGSSILVLLALIRTSGSVGVNHRAVSFVGNFGGVSGTGSLVLTLGPGDLVWKETRIDHSGIAQRWNAFLEVELLYRT